MFLGKFLVQSQAANIKLVPTVPSPPTENEKEEGGGEGARRREGVLLTAYGGSLFSKGLKIPSFSTEGGGEGGEWRRKSPLFCWVGLFV